MSRILDGNWRNAMHSTGGSVLTVFLFAVTIFLSAGLMFVIEPFVAKMLLPTFGGSPNVWNTCVVFFQFLLLSGYIYSHFLATRLTFKVQVAVQLLVVWLSLLFLPLRIPTVLLTIEHPVVALLSILLMTIGVVFFALCTTAPLLQKWYSQTSSVGASDPYFLYAASNLGGLIGLLLYPFALEPHFKSLELSQTVSNVYIAYAALLSLCGLAAFLRCRDANVDIVVDQRFDTESGDSGNAFGVIRERARWILFTLIPSSLVLGLTAYITSELSAVPFFWVAPLFIYLTTFILAFARLPHRISSAVRIVSPVVALVATLFVSSHTFAEASFGDPLITTGLSLHLITLFLVCLACHSIVASERPQTSRLTEYYVAISVGGILGSSFNTFVAPLIFKDWSEYPLMLLLSAALLVRLPKFKKTTEESSSRLVLTPILVLTICVASWSLYESMLAHKVQASVFGGQYISQEAVLEFLFQVFIPLTVCFTVARTTKQLRVCLATFALFLLWTYQKDDAIVYRGRNFFGSLSVVLNKAQNSCEFWHGKTIHGTESLNPSKRGLPTSYFFPTGPIGKIMSKMIGQPENWKTDVAEQNAKPPLPMAVLGLGCGTTAAYARKNQTVFYYEINPEVIEVASNPYYFTYLYQAKKRNVDLKIITGDARLEIQKAPYDYFQLILVDAFSSDSIPMHLITKEAAEVYLKKLKIDGVLAFNVSNQYYDMKPALAALSKELNVPAMVLSDPDDSVEGERFSTEWVVFSRSETSLNMLKELGGLALSPTKVIPVWTDDYCSPLSVLNVPMH